MICTFPSEIFVQAGNFWTMVLGIGTAFTGWAGHIVLRHQRQTSTMRKEPEMRIESKIIIHHKNMVGALTEGLHHGPPEYHRSGGD
jgi:hypothetical protein